MCTRTVCLVRKALWACMRAHVRMQYNVCVCCVCACERMFSDTDHWPIGHHKFIDGLNVMWVHIRVTDQPLKICVWINVAIAFVAGFFFLLLLPFASVFCFFCSSPQIFAWVDLPETTKKSDRQQHAIAIENGTPHALFTSHQMFMDRKKIGEMIGTFFLLCLSMASSIVRYSKFQLIQAHCRLRSLITRRHSFINLTK